jgi:Tol biopolymer transport system component
VTPPPAGITPTIVNPTITPTSGTSGNVLGYEKIVFAPDSQHVAALVYEKGYLNTILGWNAATSETPQRLLQLPSGSNADLAWSPQSQELAVLADQNLYILNGITGAIEHTFAVSSLDSWQSTDNRSSELVAHSSLSGGAQARSVAWSPDGNELVVSMITDLVGTYFNVAEVLDAQTGAVTKQLPLPTGYFASALSWSADGNYIAANGPQGARTATNSWSSAGVSTTWVWNVASTSIVFQQEGGANSLTPFAWQPGTDNLVFGASSGNGQILEDWNVTTGQDLKDISDSSSLPVLAWSADGKELAVANYSSGADVVIYDADTWTQIKSLTAGSLPLATLAWSPDDKLLLGGENPISMAGSGSANMYSWTL